MDPKPDDPVLPFATSTAFERWLAKHHRTAMVVWIKYARKGSGVASINWTEAVDVALCDGWIDGQAKSRRPRLRAFSWTQPTCTLSAWAR